MQNLLFIDLDGVMVDLQNHLIETLNFEFPLPRTEENRIVVESMWEHVHQTCPTFWEDATPMEHAQTLYNAILELCDNPYVLSATPESYGFSDRHVQCARQKRKWVQKHFGAHQAARCILTKSKLKQDVIPMFPAADRHILIDDHASNIKRWEAAGGIGIHFKNIDQALDELQMLKELP